MQELFVGLMSGTSVDSIDAVLVAFDPESQTLGALNYPIPKPIRAELLSLSAPAPNELDRIARLDNRVARLFAAATHQLLKHAGVAPEHVSAVGSHGQTIRHRPPSDPLDDEAYTVQIGNPNLIAELTGIRTVADFRRRDIAAGGHGAPLAPAFHRALIGPSDRDGVAVNIGGIANISVLPADPAATVVGYDTGPGNALLDAWIERHLGVAFDDDGLWALQGVVQDDLLQRWLSDPFFDQPPPKSTGREYFNLAWLDESVAGVRPVDVQATLIALTAESIARAIDRRHSSVVDVWIAGGGARNSLLMRALSQRLSPRPVRSIAERGIDPDYLEAIGFAWLARQTVNGLPGNLPAVTGARGPRILGAIYPA